MSNFGLGFRGIKEHILDRMDAEQLDIIVCDENFNICDITKSASKLFDVKVGDNIADFMDYDTCLKISKVIIDKNTVTVFDKIDNVYFKADASEYNGKAIIIFDDINQVRKGEIIFLAGLAKGVINDYVNIAETREGQVENDITDSALIKKTELVEQIALLKMQVFMAKMDTLAKPDTIHVGEFKTGKLSLYLEDFIEDIRQTVDGCNIKTVIHPKIECQFSGHRLMIAFISILSHVFEHFGKSTEITIRVSLKNEKVYISFAGEGCGTFEELGKTDKDARLNQMTVKSVMEEHNATMLEDKGEILMILPIVRDEGGDFESSSEYKTENYTSKKLVKILNLYN